MLNPGAVLAAVVTGYQSVAPLVAIVGSDRIYGHYDQYPVGKSLMQAIYEMQAGDIMVVYRGFGPRTGANRMALWGHQLSVLWRPPESNESADAEDMYEPLKLLVDGVPSGSPMKILNYNFELPVDQMLVPSAQRQTLIIDGRDALDYWEMPFVLTETGDA